uniref:Uncharacterized protein n=1 Tax=Cacopsylla melanoneura TaxID=428564 RepID=A0A8D8XKG3_9HEMI
MNSIQNTDASFFSLMKDTRLKSFFSKSSELSIEGTRRRSAYFHMIKQFSCKKKKGVLLLIYQFSNVMFIIILHLKFRSLNTFYMYPFCFTVSQFGSCVVVCIFSEVDIETFNVINDIQIKNRPVSKLMLTGLQNPWLEPLGITRLIRCKTECKP